MIRHVQTAVVRKTPQDCLRCSNRFAAASCALVYNMIHKQILRAASFGAAVC